MNTYTIQTPIWYGKIKRRCIGIAEFRLPCIVNIAYKDKYGNIIYPNDYRVTTAFAQKYPTKTVGNSIVLRVIPIADLPIDKRRTNEVN